MFIDWRAVGNIIVADIGNLIWPFTNCVIRLFLKTRSQGILSYETLSLFLVKNILMQ